MGSRVSVASDGTQGNDVSLWPFISGNGRIVVFESEAATWSTATLITTEIFLSMIAARR